MMRCVRPHRSLGLPSSARSSPRLALPAAGARAGSTRRPRLPSSSEPAARRPPTPGVTARYGRPALTPPPATKRRTSDRLAHRLSPRRTPPCTISTIATACCTPRRSISSIWPRRSARRSIAIRPRRSTRHYQVFAGAFADVPALVCYAMKANSNQAVIKTLARLGAGADVVSEGELKRARAAGIPPDKIMFSGDRQDRARARARGRRRHSLRQRRVRGRARAAVVDRGRQGPRPPRLGARQSRRRRQDARQDRDRQGREQVRHSDQPRARGLCPRRQAAGPQGHRRRHAYRQPDHRAAAVRRCVRAAVGFRARACAPTATDLPCRSRRRARHSLSRGQRAAAASGGLCGDGQARDPRPRLHADLRARPAASSAMPASW